MYTSNAERIYYEHNPKVKQQRENYEERQYRLAQMHNKIFRGIDQINDAKSFMKVKTMLDAYAHEEVRYNARIKPEIEKLNSEVGALYIKGFNLRQVQQKYTAELKQMKGGTVFE